jgi:hypothetical protein
MNMALPNHGAHGAMNMALAAMALNYVKDSL